MEHLLQGTKNSSVSQADLKTETMHYQTYVINYFYYIHRRYTFPKLCNVFLKHLLCESVRMSMHVCVCVCVCVCV
jgi:hypothetical protein